MSETISDDATAGEGGMEARLYINGEFTPGIDRITFPIYSPVTCELVAEVYQASTIDIDAAVLAASVAFPSWSRLSFSARGAYIKRFAALLRLPTTINTLARLDNLCIGRSPSMFFDSVTAADGLDYYAAVAEEICCGETRAFTNDGTKGESDEGVWGFTIKQPFGVVAGILPWNFPVGMFCWKVGAAVATGNTVVVKSSEKNPLSCLALAQLIHTTGFPPGVINVVSGYGTPTGEAIVSHPGIRKLTFTGSVTTGKRVQILAAQSNLKNLTLELGGKNPVVLFADMVTRGEEKVRECVDRVARSIRFLSGQTCFANGRILVEEGFSEEFMGMFRKVFLVEGLKEFSQHDDSGEHGGGRDEVGGGGGRMLEPLADVVQFERVLGYVTQARREGATVVGGERVGDKGYFMTPAIISNLPPHSSLLREEIFGPVVVVQTFISEAEAIALANNTEYGLYTSVFTGDMSRAMRVTRRLESGLVGINTTSPEMASGLPFGGWKGSGVGKEVMKAGLEGMLETKSVTLRY